MFLGLNCKRLHQYFWPEANSSGFFACQRGYQTSLTSSLCLQSLQLRHTKEVVNGPDRPSGHLRPQDSLESSLCNGIYHLTYYVKYNIALSKSSNRLDPSPNLFHPLPNSLTDLISHMPNGSPINGRSLAPLRCQCIPRFLSLRATVISTVFSTGPDP